MMFDETPRQKVLSIGSRLGSLSKVYHGRNQWRADVNRILEIAFEESDDSIGKVPEMIERSAYHFMGILVDVRNLAAAMGGGEPLVSDAHVLAVRINTHLGPTFRVAFDRECCRNDPSMVADDLVRRIEKAVGREIEEIDRLWPALIARADMMRVEGENPPPPKTDLVRSAIKKKGRAATQKSLENCIRDDLHGEISTRELQGCLDYLRDRGEFDGKTRKRKAKT